MLCKYQDYVTSNKKTHNMYLLYMRKLLNQSPNKIGEKKG